MSKDQSSLALSLSLTPPLKSLPTALQQHQSSHFSPKNNYSLTPSSPLSPAMTSNSSMKEVLDQLQDPAGNNRSTDYNLQDWIFIFSVSGMMKHVLFLVQARARQPSSSSQLWFWLLASASALDRYSGGCLLSTFLYAGMLEIAKLQIYPNEKPLIGKSGRHYKSESFEKVTRK